MVVDRPHGQVETFGNVLAGHAGGGEQHDLPFSPGERGRRAGVDRGEVEQPGGGRAFAGGGERAGAAQRCRGRPLVAGAAGGRGRTAGGFGRQQHGTHGFEVVG